MNKKLISRTVASAVIISMAAGSLTGCGASGSKLLTKTSSDETAYETDLSIENATSSISDFSLDFMKTAIGYAEDENPVLSPASAYLALALLACGSGGNTAKELSDTLHIPNGEWAAYGNKIQEWLNRSNGETTVTTADSVWFDSDGGYEAKQEYLDIVSQALKSAVYSTDLQSEEAVNEINKWVNEATKELIPTLREEPYDDSVKAVLLNALYFEAKWRYPFAAETTAEKTFTTADGKEIETDFLRDYECYRYYIEADGIEGIMMPYTGDDEHTEGDMAFIALKSTDGKTPKEVLNSLSPETLEEFTDVEDTTYMNFSMPKFDINYKQDLNNTFRDIGLEQTMSSGGADLSNMFENEGGSAMDLDAAQIVRIQVDEEGTKAAAVTEIATSESAMLEEETPIELHFDSPFLYMIIDTKNCVPIFMGILENPA